MYGRKFKSYHFRQSLPIMLSDAINFSLDIQENFHLLNGKWFSELKEKYKCVQTGNNYKFPDNSSCSWDSENNSFKINR